MTAAGVSTRECLSTGELERRLHNKYHGEDFALCFDVRNSAGFNATRACDALGIGLWPSRGCHLYGFEIKASRSDWLRELKEAAKAEAFVPYCDYWFIVAGSRDIIKIEELPPGWGLIVPKGDGLHIHVPAILNTAPLPMPRGMLAAFVKRAQTQNPNTGVVKQKYEAGVTDGIERGKRMRLSEDGGERYKGLRARVDKFKAATGIDPEFDTYNIPLLVKAMALVRMERGLGRASQDVRTITHQLANAVTQLENIGKVITDAYKETAAELAKP